MFQLNIGNSETDKHHLVLDRPHIYKCGCGIVKMIFISEAGVSEKYFEFPEKIEYLPCGHAKCALNENNECFICLNKNI